MKSERPPSSEAGPKTSSSKSKLDEITSKGPAYSEMLWAFRRDLFKTLSELMRNLNEGDPGFKINLPLRLTQIRTTHILGTSIKHLVYSSDEGNNDDVSIDYYIARELVHDFVLREVCLFDAKKRELPASPLERHLHDTREKTELLQVLLVVLIVDGHIQEAWELAFIFGACSWIRERQNEMGLMRPGHEWVTTRLINKLKLLTTFAECIAQNKLPTKMALRLDAFGKESSEAVFSRLLKEMEIRAYIPDAPKSGAKTGTQTYHSISSPFAASAVKPESSLSFVRTIAREEEEDLAPWSSIVPSGDPNMATCEIRKIRDSLGPVYWFLLMQFGMPELDSAEDLEVFVQRLHTIGLTLI